MKCLGRNLNEHCCWINNKVCKFLEEYSEPGFRWSCGLRRELGSWDAVIEDKRYMDGDDSPGRVFGKFAYKNCKNFQCGDCARLDQNEITPTQFAELRSK